MITFSFVALMLVFAGIGLSSVLRSRGSNEDYYLAGQSVSPALAGLSAVATNNSGYMFIGVIGFTYTAGLAAVWLMVGWLVGDFIASLLVHRKLRLAAERTGELSFAAVMAAWNGGRMPFWRRLAGVLTIIFLGTYAAAQIAAGGKALEGVLGWDRSTGAWMVAVLVVAYSAAGGIRASIWTDAAQSVVMLLAMVLMFFVGIATLGGFSAATAAWREIPGYFDLYPADLLLPGVAGLALFVVGWLFAGLSVIGQPHIMVRFMALDKPSHLNAARVWYYGFFTIFYALATGVGMLSRLYLPSLAELDPELALPRMAVELLPPVLVGAVLAGIFAATMSTADSLVLSCSAAITQDLSARPAQKPWQAKAATAAVTMFALFLALQDNSSVFDLVILAWSTLAVAFGPMLLLLAAGRQFSVYSATYTTIAGIAAAFAWRFAELHDALYEGLPGFAVGLAIGWGLSTAGHHPPLASAAFTRSGAQEIQ